MNASHEILNCKDLEGTYLYFIPKTKVLFSKRWLPLIDGTPLAENFAYMIGKGMGDGHLDKQFTFKHSGEKINQLVLKKVLTNEFNIPIESIKVTENKYSKGCSYHLQVNSSVFGRILFLLGCPIGNKTRQAFFIPDWITNSNNNSRYFLMGLLEDELSTIHIERRNHCRAAVLKMAKAGEFINGHHKFLSQVKNLIEKFGIECSNISKINRTDKHKTDELYFRIMGNKSNILRFSEKIGFRIHVPKKKQLEIACNKICGRPDSNRRTH